MGRLWRHGEFFADLLQSTLLSKARTGNLYCSPKLWLVHHYAAQEVYVFPTGPLLSSVVPFLVPITPSIGSPNKWNRL